MSEEAWGREPWSLIENRDGDEILGADIRDADGNVIAVQGETYPGGLSLPGYRRAVACVNALAGVPKPEGIPEIINQLRRAWPYTKDNPALFQNIGDSLRGCGIEVNP